MRATSGAPRSRGQPTKDIEASGTRTSLFPRTANAWGSRTGEKKSGPDSLQDNTNLSVPIIASLLSSKNKSLGTDLTGSKPVTVKIVRKEKKPTTMNLNLNSYCEGTTSEAPSPEPKSRQFSDPSVEFELRRFEDIVSIAPVPVDEGLRKELGDGTDFLGRKPLLKYKDDGEMCRSMFAGRVEPVSGWGWTGGKLEEYVDEILADDSHSRSRQASLGGGFRSPRSSHPKSAPAAVSGVGPHASESNNNDDREAPSPPAHTPLLRSATKFRRNQMTNRDHHNGDKLTQQAEPLSLQSVTMKTADAGAKETGKSTTAKKEKPDYSTIMCYFNDITKKGEDDQQTHDDTASATEDLQSRSSRFQVNTTTVPLPSSRPVGSRPTSAGSFWGPEVASAAYSHSRVPSINLLTVVPKVQAANYSTVENGPNSQKIATSARSDPGYAAPRVVNVNTTSQLRKAEGDFAPFGTLNKGGKSAERIVVDKGPAYTSSRPTSAARMASQQISFEGTGTSRPTIKAPSDLKMKHLMMSPRNRSSKMRVLLQPELDAALKERSVDSDLNINLYSPQKEEAGYVAPGPRQPHQPVSLRKDVLSSRIPVGYFGKPELEHHFLSAKIDELQRPIKIDVPKIKPESIRLRDRHAEPDIESLEHENLSQYGEFGTTKLTQDFLLRKRLEEEQAQQGQGQGQMDVPKQQSGGRVHMPRRPKSAQTRVRR